MSETQEQRIKPGACISWERKIKELPKIQGDEQIVRRVWEDNESLAYTFIWHCLVSF